MACSMPAGSALLVSDANTTTRPPGISVDAGKRNKIRSERSERPTPPISMGWSELFHTSSQSLNSPLSSGTAALLAVITSLITSPWYAAEGVPWGACPSGDCTEVMAWVSGSLGSTDTMTISTASKRSRLGITEGFFRLGLPDGLCLCGACGVGVTCIEKIAPFIGGRKNGRKRPAGVMRWAGVLGANHFAL